MSVNRLLKKRRQENQQTQSQDPDNSNNDSGSSSNQFNQNSNYNNGKNYPLNNQPIKVSKQDVQRQQEFEKFAQYTQYNPSTYQFTNSVLPCNATVYNRYRMPLSAYIAPISFQMDPVQRSADKIPRCGSCRAYMNYYNQCKKKSYRCFICGRQNGFLPQYVVDTQNVQLNNPCYHVLGGQKIYQEVPPQNAFVFLIDLNNSAFQSKMLYYFTAVMKQVLSKPQMDELQIYFFTYDQVVHQYDFSGDQVKCTIFDQTIKNSQNRPPQNFLGNIREKLFNLLDSLEQIAQNNKKQGSNFLQAFSYVYQSVKHTGGKIFIFQANQSLIGQSFMNQNVKNSQGQIIKTKSFLQTKNKHFFNTFIQPSLQDNISCSFFIFQRAYKNIRIFSDYCKLTNSQLNLYKKESNQDLMKFYYDFYYLLNTNYYCDVRMELVMGPGWYFTAVYGNLYRAKQYISFKFCHLQPSKKVCLLFLPQETGQLPYFSFQVITNYLYNRQHFMTVNTVVLPITCMVEKIFQNTDYSIVSASLYKTYLSSYRLQEINTCKNKMIKQLASIWKASSQFNKKKITPQISSLMLGALAFLKSYHSMLDNINDTILLDTIISQRNYLQSCNYLDMNTFFCPYLFNLSNLQQGMCQDSQNQQFVYPEILQLKFNSVKDGIFLMDWGLGMYLYIGKQYDPQLLKQLFGKQKLHKNDQLTEQNILTNTYFSNQVGNLIKVLRQQKGYGYIPLSIVRCGESSPQQKLFYLNFYAQKYQQYRSFKMNVNQFFQFLDQQF